MDFGPSWPEAGDRLKGRFFDTHNSIFYQMEEMYLDDWENISFEDKRKAADGLISSISATSDYVKIEWKI